MIQSRDIPFWLETLDWHDGKVISIFSTNSFADYDVVLIMLEVILLTRPIGGCSLTYERWEAGVKLEDTYEQMRLTMSIWPKSFVPKTFVALQILVSLY